MTRKMTKKERTEFLREKYFDVKEKLFVAVSVIIVFAILIYMLYYGFHSQWDSFLLVLLVIVIAILIPLAVFFMDTVFYEHE